MIRLLRSGDEEALEAFLAPRAETSMFLRANVRAAGLEDRGEPMQATYAAAFDGARIEAVAAHCWNGMLLLQAPSQCARVARAALDGSGRELAGVIGPADQVRVAREALGIESPRVHDVDDLYSLDLAALRVPASLARFTVRAPHDSELSQLVAWREQFLLETKLSAPGAHLKAEAESSIALLHRNRAHYVLLEGDELVAYSAFNARLPDIVQVGGVWTPPELRRRGHARCVVAGSLLEARAAGVRRAILFTSSASGARAYEALGFTRAGGYALLFV